MNLEKASIEFENFNPTHAVVDIAQEIQEQVNEESPSDSFAKTVLKRKENTFIGEMKIVSAAGTFLANISGSDPIRVLSEMARSVRHQLGHWRNTRWGSLNRAATS